MKAVQLVVNGKTYDIYPDRIGPESAAAGMPPCLAELLQALAASAGRRVLSRFDGRLRDAERRAHLFDRARRRLDRDARPARARALPRRRRSRRSPRRLSRVAATGVVLAVATGFLLFSVRPLDLRGRTRRSSPRSRWSRSASLNALSLRANRHWRVAREGEPVHGSVRARRAVARSLIWAGAVLAGRWIGFLQ